MARLSGPVAGSSSSELVKRSNDSCLPVPETGANRPAKSSSNPQRQRRPCQGQSRQRQARCEGQHFATMPAPIASAHTRRTADWTVRAAHECHRQDTVLRRSLEGMDRDKKLPNVRQWGRRGGCALTIGRVTLAALIMIVIRQSPLHCLDVSKQGHIGSLKGQIRTSTALSKLKSKTKASKSSLHLAPVSSMQWLYAANEQGVSSEGSNSARRPPPPHTKPEPPHSSQYAARRGVRSLGEARTGEKARISIRIKLNSASTRSVDSRERLTGPVAKNNQVPWHNVQQPGVRVKPHRACDLQLMHERLLNSNRVKESLQRHHTLVGCNKHDLNSNAAGIKEHWRTSRDMSGPGISQGRDRNTSHKQVAHRTSRPAAPCPCHTA